MQAAKWMGVAPWSLAEQDEHWTEWALFLMDVEQKAHERAQRKASKKGGAR